MDYFEEISTLLDDFYLDQNFNKDNTQVRGTDVCELLGLFYDLAEADHLYYLTELQNNVD